ncbi:MAG TPA: hypothetical protein VFR09_04580 [Alphaproteobacteria bacterium]|nr:hypothetical protein [Alphaproteobacteria bacterium]
MYEEDEIYESRPKIDPKLGENYDRILASDERLDAAAARKLRDDENLTRPEIKKRGLTPSPKPGGGSLY